MIMRAYDIIYKKREGMELSRAEIEFLISGYVSGSIPDYQISAFLMAVYFRGMTLRETSDLTMIMAKSGDIVDLSGISGIKVDKHSTGGVGDKASLVLGPLVAAAGVKVAKMSGRGLGHTGGTIDKLEAIPGFRTNLARKEFIKQVNDINIAIVGQSENLVPADKKLYALRDVTATVENVSLIASSIMSKKIAGGADAIVLDVKTGNGAFMKNLESAKELAEVMVGIGNHLGKKTIAILSNMDEPLGEYIGNALEIKEAILALKGYGPEDLTNLCIEIGSHMMLLAKKADNLDHARNILIETLKSGKALKKFEQMIEYQGGDAKVIEDSSLLPSAPCSMVITAPKSGYIHKLDASKLGLACMKLCAGRIKINDTIDYSAGIKLEKKVSDKVMIGDPLAIIYGKDQKTIREQSEEVANAFEIGSYGLEKAPLIYGIVTDKGTKLYN